MQNMKSMMMPMIVLMILIISALLFAWQGVSMQNRVAVEEPKFHELQNEYFTLSKAERESAPTGSELNQKLVQIQNYPSELLRLKLVGIGKILTGILSALLAIAFLLFMMPIRLAKLMKENGQQ
jgi:predicted PurR-regulated permease PerM